MGRARFRMLSISERSRLIKVLRRGNRYDSFEVFAMFQVRISKYNGYFIANSAAKTGGIRGPIHRHCRHF